jgi:hypothetical protein
MWNTKNVNNNTLMEYKTHSTCLSPRHGGIRVENPTFICEHRVHFRQLRSYLKEKVAAPV